MVACTVAFKLYDTDGDGYISSKELLAMLQLIMGKALPASQLEQVCPAETI